MNPIDVMSIYPITCSIMDHLNATSTSAFLHATRLYRTIPYETQKKYMNILRDMPSIADWIEFRISHGDSVLLVGDSLNDIRFRYNNPFMYWIKNPYMNMNMVWLISMSVKRYLYVDRVMSMPRTEPGFVHLRVDRNENITTRLYTNLFGNQHHDVDDCKGTICSGCMPANNTTTPHPSLWQDCWQVESRDATMRELPNTYDDMVVCMQHNKVEYSQMSSRLYVSDVIRAFSSTYPDLTKLPYMCLNTMTLKYAKWVTNTEARRITNTHGQTDTVIQSDGFCIVYPILQPDPSDGPVRFYVMFSDSKTNSEPF